MTAPLLSESLVVLVPGAITTAVLFPPGALCLPARLALAFVAGFSIVAFLAWTLALLSVLTVVTLAVGLGVLSIGLGAVAWRRGLPGEHLRAIRNEFRAEPWGLLTGLLLMGAVAWVRAGSSPLHSLVSNTTMRLWGDGVEIAAAGEIPERTLQWGQSVEPAASKMLFNCFSAAMDLVGGPDTLPNIAGAALLAAVFMIPALWWLGRELGLGLTAPLLPLVVAANPLFVTGEFTTDLTPYRAESFGRVVAFSALALSIVAIRANKGLRQFVVAALLFAIAALTHLVPTVVALGVLAWYVVYCLARRRLSRQVFVRLAASLAAAAFLVPAVWFLPGATIGFTGVRDSAPIVGPEDHIDPTLLFSTGRRTTLEEIRNRDWYTPPGNLVRLLVATTIDTPVQSGWWWLGMAAVAAIVLTVVCPEGLRTVGIASLALGTNIVVATLLFDRSYDSLAMAHFGPRRLFDYGPMVVWLLLLIGAELVLILARKLDPKLPPPVVLASGIALAALFLPSLYESQQLSPDVLGEVEVVNWVRENTPCDARILSNHRTSGTFQILTGRVGVKEGMGPYFRPALLQRVNGFLVETNAFFRDPSDRGDFLAENGVDYVVLFRGTGGMTDLQRTPGFPSAMEEASFLDLVYSGSTANIYRVDGVESPHDFPQPSDFPGYICRKGSLAI